MAYRLKAGRLFWAQTPVKAKAILTIRMNPTQDLFFLALVHPKLGTNLEHLSGLRYIALSDL